MIGWRQSFFGGGEHAAVNSHLKLTEPKTGLQMAILLAWDALLLLNFSISLNSSHSPACSLKGSTHSPQSLLECTAPLPC